MGSSVSTGKAKQNSQQDDKKVYKILLLGPFLSFPVSYSSKLSELRMQGARILERPQFSSR
jgi:hypothetical protein